MPKVIIGFPPVQYINAHILNFIALTVEFNNILLIA